ncbi:YhjD/YihY/BrkB family envelope integrity protein [Leptospira borgpetersenii]|uniref:Virulence factor BrkB domain protein n=1 Tax=Leptospira borgpetersenii serovar Javanica str. UI 09931 TaxID=1049767 RepID=A0AAV3JEX5_LEPBO|nr:YhjD/YihY/BrkB family envelope integrity protein [Leptospira borgpetersenii]AXX15533.1 ribonuclease BN [Leptospira borgpetersenii serovar Ceylonica]EKQ93372.1 virulence factor BrkB domain protein [Leptospira borgpetersenii str. UI 09149]EMN59142.1 virulence factor BrkB domain protein [Leptospira borgpetersenii serovar Javanica str. MK146]EPG59201.1 virulence factor BrkB domain protein [Leptospira borgpetersenii serovar Javanica str. UI 09931]MDQ7245698.1 YhjD/YihY/BrkB family envelope integ
MLHLFKPGWLADSDKIPRKGFLRIFVLFIRIIVGSSYRFIKDDCLMQASGISYTTIVSLIPMLTVALSLITITSGLENRKEEIFDTINTFILQSNISVDINTYLETIGELIDTATQIGAIGFVILVFSATAVLRSLENAFNGIWKIRSNRSLFQKFVFYFFVLAIGPLLFVIGEGIAKKTIDFFRPSHYFSMEKDPSDKIWVSGENGTLFRMDSNLKKEYSIREDEIDFENMKCLDNLGGRLDFCKKPDIGDSDFIRIKIREETVYVLSTKGILLIKPVESSVWTLTSFEGVELKDIEVVNKNNIFIIFKNGEILHYIPEGISFKPIFKDRLKMNASKVYFPETLKGYIVDESGTVWTSNDGGFNFYPNRLTHLAFHDIHQTTNGDIFLTGERGILYRSQDGGNSWIELRHKRYNFIRIWSFTGPDITELFLMDSLGNILISTDLGDHWNQFYTPMNGKLWANLLLERKENGKIKMLNVGEYRTISITESKDQKFTTVLITGGDSVFTIYSFLRILFPLSGIWLFFLSLYSLIPNTKVPLKASSAGAAVTGIIFLVFLWGFHVYLSSFSETTMIIYKALAAIPIFLLGVYSLSLIVLFGAEITASLQFKERYLAPLHSLDEIHTSSSNEFRKLISILKSAYRIQREKKIPSTSIELSSVSKLKEEEIPVLTKKLCELGFLSETRKNEFIPIIAPADLSIGDVYRKIPEPLLTGDKELKLFPGNINSRIEKTEEKLQNDLDGIKFGDLID